MNQKEIERARGILAEKKEEFNGLMESCEFPLPMREVGTFVEALGVAIACMELQVGKSKEGDIKCPACGTSETEFYDHYEDFFWDGDEYEMVCKKCGKEFSATAHVEVTFSVWEDSE